MYLRCVCLGMGANACTTHTAHSGASPHLSSTRHAQVEIANPATASPDKPGARTARIAESAAALGSVLLPSLSAVVGRSSEAAASGVDAGVMSQLSTGLQAQLQQLEKLVGRVEIGSLVDFVRATPCCTPAAFMASSI